MADIVTAEVRSRMMAGIRGTNTRPEFWRTKIGRNREVDQRTDAALAEAGWRQAIVWECALKGRTRMPLEEVIFACADWLRSDRQRIEIRGG